MLVSAAANDILLALAAFALVLIPAVIIHELGHFIAAKLVGINVLEFGIGFPLALAACSCSLKRNLRSISCHWVVSFDRWART